MPLEIKICFSFFIFFVPRISYSSLCIIIFLFSLLFILTFYSFRNFHSTLYANCLFVIRHVVHQLLYAINNNNRVSNESSNLLFHVYFAFKVFYFFFFCLFLLFVSFASIFFYIRVASFVLFE